MATGLLKSKILAWGYRNFLKPWFFWQDAEKLHERIIHLGQFLGRARRRRKIVSNLFNYQNPALAQEILGMKFPNPIGLAAGFDKNAELTDILPAVGFGFAEVGSVTGEPCAGNARPRLWRLPKSLSLLVNYGLKNQGSQIIARRLKQKDFNLPVGISIAKTNCAGTASWQAGVADYVKAYRAFAGIGSYTAINISCPNAFGGQPFTDPVSLEALLFEIDKIFSKKPVWLKLSPDQPYGEIDQLLAVISRHRVSGIICTNLTKKRDDSMPQNAQGGLSGKAVEEAANKLISYVYKKTGRRYVVIGCGGVFTAEDAYKKIRLGASLVQLITGIIYQGPQLVGQINRGLVKLLQRDGFKNISEAVGTGI